MNEFGHFDAQTFENSISKAITDYKGMDEISPRQKEELIAVFGCPKIEVKSPDSLRPPSPSEMIESTQEYVKEQKEKGFMSDDTSQDFEQELLQRKLFEYSSLKQEKNKDNESIDDLESTLMHDPEMKRWLQTDTVKTIVEEFSHLPFIQNVYLSQMLNRFYFLITAHVRKAQLMRPKRISNKYLHDEMFHFVKEAQNIRKELIGKAIKNNTLFISKLLPNYREDFKAEIDDLKGKLEESRKSILQQKQQKEEKNRNNHFRTKEEEKEEELEKERERKEVEKNGYLSGQENFDILDDIDQADENNQQAPIQEELPGMHRSKSVEADMSFFDHAKATIDPMPFVYEMQSDFFQESGMKKYEEKMVNCIKTLPEKCAQDLIAARQNSVSTTQLIPANNSETHASNPLTLSKGNTNTRKYSSHSSYANLTPKPFRILGQKLLPKKAIVKPSTKQSPKINTTLDYWISNDPLGQQREGKNYDVFQQMQSLTNIEVSQQELDPSQCTQFPHLMVADYRPPTAVVVNEKDTNITDTIWNTSQMTDSSLPPLKPQNQNKSKRMGISSVDSSTTFPTSQKVVNPYSSTQSISLKSNDRRNVQSKLTSSSDEEEPSFNGFTAKQLMQNTGPLHNTETFKYLMNHTPLDSDKMGATSRHFAKLQQYMSELGFNAYEKLELYKKYSSNVDLMSKIGELLPYWKHALDCLNTFEKVYRELKTFMETCISLNDSNAYFRTSYSNLEMVSNTLQEAGDRLKQLSNDTLYLRGRNYLEYIDRKKEKLQKIKEQKQKEEIESQKLQQKQPFQN